MLRHTKTAIFLLLISPIVVAKPDIDMKKTAQFLLGSATFQGDGQFMTVSGVLPKSYFSTPNYWGGYVCGDYARQQNVSCDVTDTARMENNNFVLNGGTDAGAALQVERIDATKGTDIYDSATWQIALALAGKNKLLNQNKVDVAIENVNKRLVRNDTRAFGDAFQYGYQTTLKTGLNAYRFRMLGDSYLEEDPFMNTQYQNYIHFSGSANDEAKLFSKISWPDWKPITGENAWGLLIGPLQADALRGKYIPYQNTSIQNAIAFIPAIQAMQAANGGIYYAPGGSDGNEGPISKGEISTENCLSMYAGLKILANELSKTDQFDPNADHLAIKTALTNIETIKSKLEIYFKNSAWDASKQQFIAGGRFDNGWKPHLDVEAVDVNTWGIAALTPKVVDEWFGDKAAFSAWQRVKQWGCYSDHGQCDSSLPIQGVGFSDQDQHQMLSGEWTFGAITAVDTMIDYYGKNKILTTAELNSLKQDDQSMRLSVLRLRTDHYANQELPNSLDNRYQVTLPKNELAYLYANKRYHIPFGWYANPIPSTASTSWAVMVNYRFNPFEIQAIKSSQVKTGRQNK